ncbi:uncharacterized protein BDW43DRAFT_15886 [Aspergillus alliaceus]|uniref:uncharacterized protein n=1 Tax=Petromyces alliaceus TaxID=209559 RepID=UPI0012A7711C|nr:uncharacterized protein BDW43DRAFT_15886 [Aspergillus alliaceus]KAB8235920.1 hypothetical protein BDW43DRAFT_15886 [Aspergillus alliaceus]
MSDFKVESWIWYGFTVLVIILRFISRLQLVKSVKSLQAEDYLMLLVLCFYTGLVVTLNRIEHAQTNLMTADDKEDLTPESIKNRIYGSKLVLATEQCMLATIWGCKGCLLLLYARLTEGIKQQLAVKILAGYVVASYIVLEILYFAVWCRPFHNYWAVPTPNEQCSTATHHLIMTMVFNISSDILMICIPLPLLISASLPIRSKITLVGVFSMGTFIILCATLSKVSSFKNPFSPEWLFWYVREASTAVCVANIPNCWSLVRRVFNLRSWTGSSHSKNRTHHYNPYGYGTGTHSRTRRTTASQKKSLWTSVTMSAVGKTESVEEIMRDDTEQGNQGIPLEIWHQTSIHVTEEQPNPNDSHNGPSTAPPGQR